MAIIKDCEIWFAKLDPKRPNNKFNKKNPTWECQIRTTSKEVKKAWEAMSLPVKAVVPDEGAPYFRVNLRKKSIKEDGEAASAVTVVNGNLDAIDPNTIGNGSRAHIRIFQYEYTKETGGKGIASVIMGLQLVKHIVYKPKARDDEFGFAETEVVDADDEDGFDDVADADDSVTDVEPKKVTPAVSKRSNASF